MKNEENATIVASEKNENVNVKFLDVKSKLQSFAKKDLLISSKGAGRENLYKESIIKNLTDKEKKSFRKNVRNLIDSYSESILRYNSEKNDVKLKEIKENFLLFYGEFFEKNDFSLESITSGNSSDSRKEKITKMLEIVKG